MESMEKREFWISFGDWLERRRKALDLTREEFARKVGCSVSGLRKVESDERRPSKQLAELLAGALEIPAEQRAAFIRIARGGLSPDRLKFPAPLPDLGLLQPPPAFIPSLPVAPTPLIGREPEISALRQMRSDPQCRLITLVGPGGIGKIRLATEIAGNPGSDYAHGAVFVQLANVKSPALLLPAIADALGLTFYGATDPRGHLLGYLREKQMLLVVDNLAHLLQGADLFAEIVQSAPHLKTLCTPRERLNLRGEWIFEVGGLQVPEAEDVERLEDFSATALFLQVAQRAMSGHQLKR